MIRSTSKGLCPTRLGAMNVSTKSWAACPARGSPPLTIPSPMPVNPSSVLSSRITAPVCWPAPGPIGRLPSAPRPPEYEKASGRRTKRVSTEVMMVMSVRVDRRLDVHAFAHVLQRRFQVGERVEVRHQVFEGERAGVAAEETRAGHPRLVDEAVVAVNGARRRADLEGVERLRFAGREVAHLDHRAVAAHHAQRLFERDGHAGSLVDDVGAG